MNYNKLKEKIKESDVTIRDFCKLMGLTPQGFHKNIKENGLRIGMLEKMSNKLGVPMVYWFEESKSIVNEQMIQYRRENEPNIEELRSDLKYFRERCIALEKEIAAMKGENKKAV
jgi:transcriptional regulator with XRE-family HTH domain